MLKQFLTAVVALFLGTILITVNAFADGHGGRHIVGNPGNVVWLHKYVMSHGITMEFNGTPVYTKIFPGKYANACNNVVAEAHSTIHALVIEAFCRIPHQLNDREIFVINKVRVVILVSSERFMAASQGWVEDGGKTIHVADELFVDVMSRVVNDIVEKTKHAMNPNR